MSHLSVSRRALLLGTGALAFSNAAGRVAFAASQGDRKLVVVVLRGAMDGLAAVAPYGDPNYQSLRRRLALGPPGSTGGVMPIDAGFGLHPQFQFLAEAWRSQELAIMHAVSSPYRDRSHFDGQDVLESGGDKVFAVSDGWLNRAIALLPPGTEGVAISSTIPLILRGSAKVTSWFPSSAPSASEDTLYRLMDLYAGDPLLAPALATAMETETVVGGQTMAGGGKGAAGGRYGAAAVQQLMEAAAKILIAPNGPAAAVVSIDGWDTHANQGAAQGLLATRFAALDAGLRALKQALGNVWSRTAVITATEFGRTVAENGTGGTDHGTASVAFLLGGAVKGGRMLGEWPGLAQSALYEGRDLAPANDLRRLFTSVMASHWALDPRLLADRVFFHARAMPALEGLIRT